MKRNILTLVILFLAGTLCFSQTGVEFTIRKSADNTKYEAYMRPNFNLTFPQNITGTGQMTIKVPSSAAFIVTGLQTNTMDHISGSPWPGSGSWQNNARINSPVEEPNFDYLSFGYNSGSFQYRYEPGVEVLLFTFNVPDPCLATIQIVNNFTDPFSPPNSQSANIGNSLVAFGSQTINNGTGLFNMWYGNYSPSASCPNVPLPLDLISFTGKIDNCRAVLSWVTDNEINVSHFYIEKSLDGEHWEVIGSQEAAGNTEELTNYSFTDDRGGYEFYYRLMIVDLDGSYEYSDVVFLSSDCVDFDSIHEIYPVPVTETLNFSVITSFDGKIKFLVFDDLGRQLLSTTREVLKGFNEFNIDTRILANGVYFLQPLIEGRYVPAEKFVKFHH